MVYYSEKIRTRERTNRRNNERVGRMWNKFSYGRGLKRWVIPMTVSLVLLIRGISMGAPLMPTE